MNSSAKSWRSVYQEYTIDQLSRIHYLRRTSLISDSEDLHNEQFRLAALEQHYVQREDSIVAGSVSYTKRRYLTRRYMTRPNVLSGTGLNVSLDSAALERMNFVDPENSHMFQFIRQYSLELASAFQQSPLGPSQRDETQQTTARALQTQRRALQSRLRRGSDFVLDLVGCINGSRAKQAHVASRSLLLEHRRSCLAELVEDHSALLLQTSTRRFLAKRRVKRILKERAARTLQAVARTLLARRSVRESSLRRCARRIAARRISRWWKFVCSRRKWALPGSIVDHSAHVRSIVVIQGLVRGWLARREAAWRRAFCHLRTERTRQRAWETRRRSLLLISPIEQSLVELELHVDKEREFVDVREATERAAFDDWWAKFQNRIRRHYADKSLPSTFMQVKRSAGKKDSENTTVVFVDLHTGVEHTEHPHVVEARRILQQEHRRAMTQLKDRLQTIMAYRQELNTGYEKRKAALLQQLMSQC